MKLNKAIVESEFSMRDILQMENEFLYNELEFQEMIHSFELVQTIIDCIHEEGYVSQSLKNMFGENWTDSETILEDLEQSSEKLFDLFKKSDSTTPEFFIGKLNEMFSKINKIKNISLQQAEKLTYPINVKYIVYNERELESICADFNRINDEYVSLSRTNDSKDIAHLKKIASELKESIPDRLRRGIAIGEKEIHTAEDFIRYRDDFFEQAKTLKTFLYDLKDASKDLFNKTGVNPDFLKSATASILWVILLPFKFVIKILIGIIKFILNVLAVLGVGILIALRVL